MRQISTKCGPPALEPWATASQTREEALALISSSEEEYDKQMRPHHYKGVRENVTMQMATKQMSAINSVSQCAHRPYHHRLRLPPAVCCVGIFWPLQVLHC